MIRLSPFIAIVFFISTLTSCSATETGNDRSSPKHKQNSKLSLEADPALIADTTDTIDFAQCAIYVAKTTAMAATIVQYQSGLVAAGTFTAAEMGVINSMLTTGAYGAAIAYMTRHWQPAAHGTAVNAGVQSILNFLQEQADALQANRTICEQSWETYIDINNPDELPGLTEVPAIMCYAEETPGQGWPDSCGTCCAAKWQDHNPGVQNLTGFIDQCVQECEAGRQDVRDEMAREAAEIQEIADHLLDMEAEDRGWEESDDTVPPDMLEPQLPEYDISDDF